MSKLLNSIKKYFENNSQQQIIKDWSEFEEYDEIGLQIDEFEFQSNLFYKIETGNSYWEFINMDELNENPEFTSDFLFKFINFAQ